jgi:hypothetical protein
MSYNQRPLPPAIQRPAFLDVDRIANSSGLVAVISQRSKDGILTFAFFREFPSRDGERTDRTGFIPYSMHGQLVEMAQLVEERCAQLLDPAHPDHKKLPFPIV